MTDTERNDDLDLTPRQPTPARRSRRRWLAGGVLLLVVVAIAFVLFRGLGDASLFFRNVDEAVDQRDDLAGERFRMQGSPVSGTIDETVSTDGQAAVAFEITFNGVNADVVHTGSPPQLFQPDVPVVLEGRWIEAADGFYFASDRMLVKHDNEYRVDNEDRIREAEERGQN